MLLTTTIFIIVFLICYLRPYYGFVVLLNINLIRNLINIDIVDPCLKCTSENDVVLGALLPILGFLIIIYKIDFLRLFKSILAEFEFNFSRKSLHRNILFFEINRSFLYF